MKSNVTYVLFSEFVDKFIGVKNSITKVRNIKELCSILEKKNTICIIVDYKDIQPSLIKTLQQSGKSFGLIPVNNLNIGSLNQFFDELKFKNKLKIAAYSVRGLDAESFSLNDIRNKVNFDYIELKRLNSTGSLDASRVLPNIQELDVLGIITEGRQTYCGFGDGCLHPTENNPDIGIIGAESINARHWFLQSCHSPFTWDDFGDYMSFPISLMITNKLVQTVICSCRVQTLIPNILELYFQLVLNGIKMGEIVLQLNQYANERRVDKNPFFLLGDPNQRLIYKKNDSSIIIYDHFTNENIHAQIQLRFYQRCITNIAFLTKKNHFGFKDGNSNLGRICNLIKLLSNNYQQKISELQTNKAMVSLTSQWDWLIVDQIKSTDYSLDAISKIVIKLFLSADGYYYQTGPTLEQNYIANKVDFTTDSMSTLCRQLTYIGLYPCNDNNKRSQVLDDKNLAVGDLCENLSANFSRILEGNIVKFKFVNKSEYSRWVFGYILCEDPNNLSANSSKSIYRLYIDNISLRPMPFGSRKSKNSNKKYLEFIGKEIRPNESYTMELELSVPEDLFYLLIEGHFFIDFSWNWLSVTYRNKKINKWLNSNNYYKSIPQYR